MLMIMYPSTLKVNINFNQFQCVTLLLSNGHVIFGINTHS